MSHLREFRRRAEIPTPNLVRKRAARAAAKGPEEAPRHRVAVLPYRRRSDLEILLLRTEAGPSLPSGWALRGRDERRSATFVASCEAGVVGTMGKLAVGSWTDDDVRTTVYPLSVARELDGWRDVGSDATAWTPLREAMEAVRHPGLAGLLARIAERPALLPGVAIPPRRPQRMPGM